MQVHNYKKILLCLIVIGMAGIPFSFAHGQSAEELKKQIEERNKKIAELEREIKENETKLHEVGKEKKTLQNAIQTLDISRQKISTDISLTENKIDATDYRIGELENDIDEQERRIQTNQSAVAETLRKLYQTESQSLIETVLAHDTLSEVWDEVETLERFQLVMRDEISQLTLLKAELEETKEEERAERNELSSYKQDLSGKKQVLDQNKKEKDDLLRVTESEEAAYQRLLEEKRTAREEFLAELQNLEAQLQFTLDPNSIPTASAGILGWPVGTIRITQYFGNTQFAQSGAYSGKGHNGVDFGVSSGTRVQAALGGIVKGTGNTDAIPGCYSYGKWVLIEHSNGLATLYAHLSVISVGPGETVATGQPIGYSGNTGYSTGPHLHFTVYLSEAVEVKDIGRWYRENGRAPTTACAKGNAVIPVAPLEAYLNPIDYLPAL